MSKTFEDINIDKSEEPEIIARSATSQDIELESSDEESETFNFMESKLEQQRRKNKASAAAAPKSTKINGPAQDIKQSMRSRRRVLASANTSTVQADKGDQKLSEGNIFAKKSPVASDANPLNISSRRAVQKG